MIDKNDIENIKQSIDIVNIISQFVKLEKKGNNYMARCPFGHSDSNPSFSVNKDLQMFQCFSCHKKGNVFNFFMELDRIGFRESVIKVASLIGYELKGNYKNNAKKESILYKIYEDTQKIYFNNLKTKEGILAKKYLQQRNIDDNLIDIFGIGYALKDRSLLVNIFKDKYNYQDLLNSGLLSLNDGIYYDSYCDRIMFPIHNLDGKIVGYSGRIYDQSNTNYKYINTKQTEIFKKGELIYNYHRAIPYCRKLNKVIIMEGFMDVINSYKNGICNVIAMMGTAFSKQQASSIKKLADEIILCFDGDDAGLHASYTTTNELLKYNIIPKIVVLEDKLDPDEYINKYGKDKFIEKLDNPLNVMDFKLRYLKQGKNFSSIDDKKKYIKEVTDEINMIHDDILTDLTINKLIEETGISKSIIQSFIKKEKKEIAITEKKVDIKEENYIIAQRNIIYYMLKNKEVINTYNKKNIYFPTLKYRTLARYILNYYKENKNIDNIKEDASIDILETIYDIESLNLGENFKNNEIFDYIKLILEYNIACEIKRLQEELVKTDDYSKKISIAEEIRRLKMKGEEND